MRITVGNDLYDVRFRQTFVSSKIGKHKVRQTEATLSHVDPNQKGAKKYTQQAYAVLTQNVKDTDDKMKARRMALGRVLKGSFDKNQRASIWEVVLPELK